MHLRDFRCWSCPSRCACASWSHHGTVACAAGELKPTTWCHTQGIALPPAQRELNHNQGAVTITISNPLRRQLYNACTHPSHSHSITHPFIFIINNDLIKAQVPLDRSDEDLPISNSSLQKFWEMRQEMRRRSLGFGLHLRSSNPPPPSSFG